MKNSGTRFFSAVDILFYNYLGDLNVISQPPSSRQSAADNPKRVENRHRAVRTINVMAGSYHREQMATGVDRVRLARSNTPLQPAPPAKVLRSLIWELRIALSFHAG
jgi:hypothetical protein